jgi:hypothetical protein
VQGSIFSTKLVISDVQENLIIVGKCGYGTSIGGLEMVTRVQAMIQKTGVH